MLAPEIPPGAVVFCQEDGEYYQAPDGKGAAGWSKMQLIPFFGPPQATAPLGELTLVARDGKPACGH